VGVRFEPQNLELFDPTAQEQSRASPATIHKQSESNPQRTEDNRLQVGTDTATHAKKQPAKGHSEDVHLHVKF
jgi:hypothetical protein